MMISDRNTRMVGVMPHAMYSDPEERRRVIRSHNDAYHEFGFGTVHRAIKFDPSIDGVAV